MRESRAGDYKVSDPKGDSLNAAEQRQKGSNPMTVDISCGQSKQKGSESSNPTSNRNVRRIVVDLVRIRAINQNGLRRPLSRSEEPACATEIIIYGCPENACGTRTSFVWAW